MAENPYGFAVMYINGEQIGEYIGYFQTDLEDAQSVADELRLNNEDAASAAGVGATPIGIYKLVLVQTLEAPVEEEEEDDDG